MVKKKAPAPRAQNASKDDRIFVDKSGLEQAQEEEKKKSELEERIRHIHIKPPTTLKQFIQPLEPNLERTPQIQLKQLGGPGAEELRLQYQTEIIEGIKAVKEMDALPETERTKVDVLLDNLPNLPTIGAMVHAAKGNLLPATLALIRGAKMDRAQAERLALQDKVKQRKEVTSLEKDALKLQKQLKEYQDKVKIVTEKGRKVPVKEDDRRKKDRTGFSF